MIDCLGVDLAVGFDWAPTQARERVVPERVKRQEAEKKLVLERLAKLRRVSEVILSS